jgi:kynurenine formamidase
MGKYNPLKLHLENLPDDITLRTYYFSRIEAIIEDNLPKSAYKYNAWWSNEHTGTHVQANAWIEAGWKVSSVNLIESWVTFQRKQI